jgi:membrane associated rhomboid family serine protease
MLSTGLRPLQASIGRSHILANPAPHRTITRLSNNPTARTIFSRRKPISDHLRPQHIIRSYSSYGYYDSTSNYGQNALWLILGINTAVFATWNYAQSTKDGKLLKFLNDNFLCSWSNINIGRWWTSVTSAFSHINVAHFAFNMIGFWSFGNAILFAGWGAGTICGVYLGGAIVGSVAWLYQRRLANPSRVNRGFGPWGRPGTWDMAQSLGASGAVMALSGTMAVLMPTAPMGIIFLPIRAPAWVAVGAFAALDYYLMESNDNIGHAAHLGGLVSGLAFGVGLRLLRLRRGRW